jgi:hypothetical protein
MKLLTASFTFLMLQCLFSCSKAPANNTTNNTPADSASYLSSVYSYSVLDSFKYDSRHRMAQLLVFDSGYHLSPLHSQVISFTFAADSSVVPATYSIYDVQADSTEQHVLSYDSLNRIIKDTSSGSGFVHYFTYLHDTVVSVIYYYAISGNPALDEPETDSLMLSDSNVIHGFRCNSLIISGYHSSPIDYSFTSYANPAYAEKISASIGPLLSIIPFTGTRIFNGFAYFMSKDLISVTTGTGTAIWNRIH